MQSDRLPALLLALCLAMAALLLLAALGVEAPAHAAGAPHPEHASLQRGGDGASRAEPVLLLGWAFGALQIVFFAACFALGLRRRGRLAGLARPIVLSMLAYQAAFALLVAAYWRFARDPAPALVLSFPLPTALMLYLLWPLPLLFLVIYVRAFDGWILRTRDLERFRELLAERRRDGGEER